MSCEKCGNLGVVQIRLPGDLTRGIRRCKELVESGQLVPSDYWPPRSPKFTDVPWADLPDGGPWEDIVYYFFACPHCAQLFSLHADTYHGSGGRFGRYQASA